MFGEHVAHHVFANATASISDAHFGADDVGWSSFGPSLGCTLLATIVVSLRWYTRCRLVRCVGWDDFVILLSMILAWAMCVIVGIEASERVGIHSMTIRDSDITKLIVANNSLWALTVNLTKASILTQYLRIFSSRSMRIACLALLGLLLPIAAYGLFGGIFLCRPVAKLWNPTLPGLCPSPSTYWLPVACLDITLDIIILLLPLPAIASLHLPRKQKFLTMSVFLTGFAVCAISVVRVATVTSTAARGAFVRSGIDSIIWSAVESNVGIICASLLALKALLVRVFPGLAEDSRIPSHCLRLSAVSDDENFNGADVSRSSQQPVLRSAQPQPVAMPSAPSTPTTTTTKSRRWSHWSVPVMWRGLSVSQPRAPEMAEVESVDTAWSDRDAECGLPDPSMRQDPWGMPLSAFEYPYAATQWH